MPAVKKSVMISARKLIKMARKWEKIAAPLKRKRLSYPMKNSQVVEKGHFIAYTTDKVRFAFPISYLKSFIFRELLRMSEEEFGVPSDGPIRVPCDSQFMGYVTSLIHKKAPKDVEKALLAASRYSVPYNFHQQTCYSHY